MSATRKRILIGCPQYSVFVTGSYPCDADGHYLLGRDGSFNVELALCGQMGGQCRQCLCVLHRLNRKKSGSWYPTEILAPRNRVNDSSRSSRPPKPSNAF